MNPGWWSRRFGRPGCNIGHACDARPRVVSEIYSVVSRSRPRPQTPFRGFARPVLGSMSSRWVAGG